MTSYRSNHVFDRICSMITLFAIFYHVRRNTRYTSASAAKSTSVCSGRPALTRMQFSNPGLA
jgi:hypothetical protein